MNFCVMILPCAVIAFAGCYSISKIEDAEADQHMAAAEEHERLGNFQKAEEQYLIVVEQLANSAPYAHAVHSLAMLSLNPSNPAQSDSAAIMWFRAYLPHTPSGREREHTLLHLRLLERVLLLESEAAEKATRLDSVAQQADSLSHELHARSKRFQQVETELKQVTTELTRLREVDVQLHRRKK